MLRNQIARFAFRNFFALVNHQQSITQTFRLVHEVGGQQDRLALLHQHLQTLPHQMPGLRVKACGGFIEQQHLRLVDQGARQTQTALHAPRQLTRLGFGLAGQSTKLQERCNAGFDVTVFHSEVAAIDQQIFFSGEIGVQGVHLRHNTQTGLDGHGLIWHGQRVKEGDAARIGRCQSQAHSQSGGFARPIGANHPQAFPCRDLERQVVNHLVGAKTFLQILYVQ